MISERKRERERKKISYLPAKGRSIYMKPMYIYVICQLGGSYRAKIVAKVLKMLPEAAGQGQLFQDQGHSFLLYRLPRWQITYIYMGLTGSCDSFGSHPSSVDPFGL